MSTISNYIFAIILVLCSIGNTTYAQRSFKKNAIKMFELGIYPEALNGFKRYKGTAKDPRLLVKRGICYFMTGKPKECIEDMAAAHQLKSLNNERFLYMAESYLLMSNYEEAAKFYKIYLEKLPLKSLSWYEIVHKIKKCAYAIDHRSNVQSTYVENLGPGINTIYDEFSPVQSPNNQERYYFSSCRETATGGLLDAAGLTDNVGGRYFADLYKVDLKDGKWSSVLPFELELNSTQHDVLLDFNPDGSEMYFMKTRDLKIGEMFADTFTLDRATNHLPTKISGHPFNPSLGDKDLSIFSDSLVFFASDRLKGFGGFDIYYSYFSDSSWSEPINIGEGINSKFNDLSPALTKNGKSMYFISDRLQGFGGYDIFKSSYQQNNNIWTIPLNLGMPVNSPSDELDIELSADGTNFIFTSNRIEGLGGKDLYISYFKDQELDQLDYIDVPIFVSYYVKQKINEDSLSPAPVDIDLNYPKRDFLCHPIYFSETEEVLNALNLNHLRKVIDLLMIYPELKVRISSHFTPETRPDFDLYFSIKRAEKVSEYLIRNGGIDPSRIYTIGGGSNYPVTMNEINGRTSTLAIKLNRRIDIDFFDNDPKLNLNINNSEPIVAEQFMENTWQNFEDNNKGLSFRVLFTQANQMIQDEIFSLRRDACIEKRANEDKYAYTFGNTKTYAEARAIKTELIRTLERQGFIIKPYLNGVPLGKESIQRLSKTYEELEIYLRQE
jgi:outer membrane protein OmpA-like peptidoglycan-associated protein